LADVSLPVGKDQWTSIDDHSDGIRAEDHKAIESQGLNVLYAEKASHQQKNVCEGIFFDKKLTNWKKYGILELTI
jgi:hypothetical protein